MSSNNAQSAVTYTFISFDSDGPSWGIPLMNADEFLKMDPYEEVSQQGKVHPLSLAYVSNLMELDEHVPVYVLKLEHPEYHASSDDDIQVEYDDEDPEEDPKEDPSEEHEPEDDDEDPNEEHELEDEDTKEPSEGSDETEPFEEDETAVTPPPPRHHGVRISVRPQTPMAASTQTLIDAFGRRAAMIHMRDNILEEDMPPQRRFVLTAPSPGCEVAESSAAAAVAVRAPRRDVGYVRALQASERRMMTSIEEVNLRVSYQAQVHRQESKIMLVTRQGTNDAMTPESIQAMIDQAIQRKSTHTQDDASQSSGGGLRRPMQPAQLALMCTKFLADETEKVDKYINGLPDNIYGNVMSIRSKTFDETIKLANNLMDQKLHTYAERHNENKRKADDSSRNNQQQQPHKKQNVARAYTAGPSENKVYTGDLPMCTKYNYHHTGQCAPKCGKRYSHTTTDCQNCPKLKNRGNNIAQGRAYALGGRDASLDSNVITENHYDVELADGKVIEVNTIICGCTLNFMNYPFNIDLMPVLLGSFDVIIGMDWLTKYHGVIVGESSPNLTSSNPKRRNRRHSKQPFFLEESVDTMIDQRTMAQLLRAPTEGYTEAIVVPPFLAEHFELKHSLINMMTSDQLSGLEKDNPHDHIRAARRWLEKEPPRSILTWEDLVSKFINEFFPPSRTTNLRNEISNFQQWFDESFHEAWDRYKDLLRACPHHGFTELHQLDTLYNALNSANQDSLNSAAGGNLLERRTQDVLKIIENKSKVYNSRNKSIVSQVKSNDASVKVVEEICVTCGGAHPYYQFLAADGNTFLEFWDNIQRYVSAAAINFNQSNFGYRPLGVANQIRPPGFSQPNVQNNQNQFSQPQGYNRGNNFNQDSSYQAPIQQNQVVPLSELEKIKKMNEINIKAMKTQINNVKNELRNEIKTFIQASINTIANPKGELKAITTRSGLVLVLDGPSIPMPPPFINPEEDERV
uniref:Retrotransposon gag domain-containing protein n=1 Tax=Tanacetum cinerariifolium TaxID=118510 RepID=A0A6L2J927_TANCI|nr:hypothetical protein [Tanacetum cinerariifolium]